jgi:glycosyltransferase involved in cell wall biosynthesis
MRVLFVTNMWPDAERPWYGTFVKTQADSLERIGVDVDVLAIRGYAGRSAYLDAARELRRRARRPDFDLIHAHYGHSAVVARLQRARPLVVSYCGDDLLGTPDAEGRATLRSRAEAAVFRQVARVAAATITKSAEMERALPRSCRARNRVIPNGVDVVRFAPIPREEARRRLGWDTDAPIALFVGNPAIARKNFALARAATERAAARLPGLELRPAQGYPPAEVPVLMSAADVLVLTSLSEGSPNVVKEAMAAALPVVSTPVGDVEERLRGVEGCHVCGFAPDPLADKLVSAVRQGRSPAARAAIAELSLDNVAKRVHAVYRAVLAVPGGGVADLADPDYAGGDGAGAGLEAGTLR